MNSLVSSVWGVGGIGSGTGAGWSLGGRGLSLNGVSSQKGGDSADPSHEDTLSDFSFEFVEDNKNDGDIDVDGGVDSVKRVFGEDEGKTSVINTIENCVVNIDGWDNEFSGEIKGDEENGIDYNIKTNQNDNCNNKNIKLVNGSNISRIESTSNISNSKVKTKTFCYANEYSNNVSDNDIISDHLHNATYSSNSSSSSSIALSPSDVSSTDFDSSISPLYSDYYHNLKDYKNKNQTNYEQKNSDNVRNENKQYQKDYSYDNSITKRLHNMSINIFKSGLNSFNFDFHTINSISGIKNNQQLGSISFDYDLEYSLNNLTKFLLRIITISEKLDNLITYDGKVLYATSQLGYALKQVRFSFKKQF